MRELVLECPSGVSGNLLASALVAAGLAPAWLATLTTVLGLDGFSLTWDGPVLDGQGGTGTGSTAALAPTLAARLTAVGAARLTPAGCTAPVTIDGALRAAARLAAAADVALSGHDWADTLFDLAAVGVGLAALGGPRLSVVGPLPQAAVWPDTVATLCAGWPVVSVPVPYELVTPTGAALLAACAHPRATLPADAVPVATLTSRYARAAGLAPLVVHQR